MEEKTKIYQKGEKILREKAKEVPVERIAGNKRIQEIIKKMSKAIRENEEAIAIAAPQIGENLKIFLISEWVLDPDPSKNKNEFKNIIFINPSIIKSSQKKSPVPEGCLSAPGLFGNVNRSEKVKVEAYNETGKKFSRGASGLFSQAIQHEMDHLNGILFIDKATDLTKNITPPKI